MEQRRRRRLRVECWRARNEKTWERQRRANVERVQVQVLVWKPGLYLAVCGLEAIATYIWAAPIRTIVVYFISLKIL